VTGRKPLTPAGPVAGACFPASPDILQPGHSARSVAVDDVDAVGVGDVRMLRTFRVGTEGGLLPLNSAAAWRDGWSTATCSRDCGHTPPAPRCRCGFYGYWDPASVTAHPAGRHLMAVVAAHGELEVGSCGARAQRARVEAIWLGPRIDERLAQAVGRRYPTARIYRDRGQMLGDFPVPGMAGRPAPRLGETGRGRLRSGLWLFAALVALLSAVPSYLGTGIPDGRALWIAVLAFAAANFAGAMALRSWSLAFAGPIPMIWLITAISMTPFEGALYRCLLLACAACIAVAWRRHGLPGRCREARGL
jgi:hypothetical protein